jgi:hypothetical protein
MSGVGYISTMFNVLEMLEVALSRQMMKRCGVVQLQWVVLGQEIWCNVRQR